MCENKLTLDRQGCDKNLNGVFMSDLLSSYCVDGFTLEEVSDKDRNERAVGRKNGHKMEPVIWRTPRPDKLTYQ